MYIIGMWYVYIGMIERWRRKNINKLPFTLLIRARNM